MAYSYGGYSAPSVSRGNSRGSRGGGGKSGAGEWATTYAIRQAQKSGGSPSDYLVGGGSTSTREALAKETQIQSQVTGLTKPTDTTISPSSGGYSKAVAPQGASTKQKLAEQTALLVAQRGSPAMATSLSAKYGYGTDYQAQANARAAATAASRASTGSKYGMSRAEYLGHTRPQNEERLVQTEAGEVIPESEFRRRAIGGTPSGYQPRIDETGLGVNYEFVRYEPDTLVRVGSGDPSGFEVVGGKAGAGMSVQSREQAEALLGEDTVNPFTGEVTKREGEITPVYNAFDTIPFSEFVSRTQGEAKAQGFNAIITTSGPRIGVDYEPVEYSSSEFKALTPEAQSLVRKAREVQRVESTRKAGYAELVGVVKPPASGLTPLLGAAPIGARFEASKYLGVGKPTTDGVYVVELPDIMGNWAKGSAFSGSKEQVEQKISEYNLAVNQFQLKEMGESDPWVKGFREFTGLNPLTGFTGEEDVTPIRLMETRFTYQGKESASWLDWRAPTGKAQALGFGVGESVLKSAQDFVQVGSAYQVGSKEWYSQFNEKGEFTPYLLKYPEKSIGFAATSVALLAPAFWPAKQGLVAATAPKNFLYSFGQKVATSPVLSGFTLGGALGGGFEAARGGDRLDYAVASGAAAGAAYGFVGEKFAERLARQQTARELMGIDDFGEKFWSDSASKTLKGYDLTVNRQLSGLGDSLDDAVSIRMVGTSGSGSRGGVFGKTTTESTFIGYGDRGTTFTGRTGVELKGLYTTARGQRIPISEYGVAWERGVITPVTKGSQPLLFAGDDVLDDLYSFTATTRYGRVEGGLVKDVQRSFSSGTIQDIKSTQVVYDPRYVTERGVRLFSGDGMKEASYVVGNRWLPKTAPTEIHQHIALFDPDNYMGFYAGRSRIPVSTTQTTYAFAGTSLSDDVLKPSASGFGGSGSIRELPKSLVETIKIRTIPDETIFLGQPPQSLAPAPRAPSTVSPGLRSYIENLRVLEGGATVSTPVTPPGAVILAPVSKAAPLLTKGLLSAGVEKGLTTSYKGALASFAGFAGASASAAPSVQAMQGNQMEGFALAPQTATVSTLQTQTQAVFPIQSFEQPATLFKSASRLQTQDVVKVSDTLRSSKVSARVATRSPLQEYLKDSKSATRLAGSSDYLKLTRTDSRTAIRSASDYARLTDVRGDTRLATRVATASDYLTLTRTRTATRTATRPPTGVFNYVRVPPRPPIVGGFRLGSRFKLRDTRKSSKKGDSKRGYSRVLTPYADWLSKSETEARTGKLAHHPTESVSRREWFKSFGQRVPTAEMLNTKRFKLKGK